jgi:hypothetical protein
MTPPTLQHPYTHPGEPAYVMRCYRRYILNTKRKVNEQLESHGKPPTRRGARSLVHYRPIVLEYLAAKRVFLATPLARPLTDEQA